MQVLLVSLIVAAAAGYAGWQLMPRGMRRGLIGRLVAIAPSWRAWLARLEANAENGGCSSCRGCAADGRLGASAGRARIVVHRRGSR